MRSNFVSVDLEHENEALRRQNGGLRKALHAAQCDFARLQARVDRLCGLKPTAPLTSLSKEA